MRVLLQETEKTLADAAAIAFSGEDVILIDNGRVIARVTSEDIVELPQPGTSKRKAGFLKALGYKVPQDIKTPFQKEIDEMFYGDADSQ